MVQIGKYIINVSEGKDILIGDRLDRALLKDVRDFYEARSSPLCQPSICLHNQKFTGSKQADRYRVSDLLLGWGKRIVISLKSSPSHRCTSSEISLTTLNCA